MARPCRDPGYAADCRAVCVARIPARRGAGLRAGAGICADGRAVVESVTVEIRTGDCRQLLKAMPDESVNCVVTSPPYWGLRSYLPAGHPDKANEMGQEATLGEHLAALTEVFREVRRILKKDGTCWINYGDSYATHPNGRAAKDVVGDDRCFRDKPFSTIGGIYSPTSARTGSGNNKGHRSSDETGRIHSAGYLKPKDLCMIANRLAIALQDDGWWVRSEIIWHKPNPMPESVTDRPATAHEKVWMLSKSQKYWYDAEAVKRPMVAASVSRLSQDVENQEGSARANGGQKTNGKMKAVGKIDKQRGHSRRHAGFNDRWDAMSKEEQTASAHLKNVWTIPTFGFSGAHFATFPPALVEICLKAGCPVGGTVMDPFGGSGTTGMVADRLGRNAILMELNPDGLAENRIRNDAGMFASVVVS